MGDVRRLFSRREKKPARLEGKDTLRSGQHASHFGNVFVLEDDSKVKGDREEERAIVGILERLRSYGINTIKESNARYALRKSKGDADDAFKLLLLLQETREGLLKPYDPRRQLLGAENRQGVTCYLDALLFAMFVRLDSFEAMLYDSLEDKRKKRLADMLRLWVNMLRTGRLITADITQSLQEALADCGWSDARQLRQQDASEAFTFITDQLQLPLMTLKMDLYHTGKDDPTDDHKFVNERLLEVAIPEHPKEGKPAITLEDCLEAYFNNRIEVKRFLENQRRNTIKSDAEPEASSTPPRSDEKASSSHVEVVELQGTPTTQTPNLEERAAFVKVADSSKKARPGFGRIRQDSIFNQRKIELIGIDPEAGADGADGARKDRKMSTRTEVSMPAWQFFKLLPWYTDHMPTSDAQVAAHFARQRPVLGICLKRYSYDSSGHAQRRDTYVDIPIDIEVPSFVSDEDLQDGIDGHTGSVGGRFRLLLQSAVCHRGTSVHSGHYVTLCRGVPTPEQRRQFHAQQEQANSEISSDSDEPEPLMDPWMRFDDLAKERVTLVDIREALRQELPYLLFYQVQPIDEDGHSHQDELPTYAEAISRNTSDAGNVALEKSDRPYLLNEAPGSENALVTADSHPDSMTSAPAPDARPSTTTTSRPSLEVPRSTVRSGSHARHGRSESREPRRSMDQNSLSTTSASAPPTPSEDRLGSSAGSAGSTSTNSISAGFLNVANRLNPRSTSKTSVGGASTMSSLAPVASHQSEGSASHVTSPQSEKPERESRFSLNMSKLTSRMGRGTSTHSGPRDTGSAVASRTGSMSTSGRPNAGTLRGGPANAVAVEDFADTGVEGDYFPKGSAAGSVGTAPSASQAPSQTNSNITSPLLSPAEGLLSSGPSPSVSEDSGDTARPASGTVGPASAIAPKRPAAHVDEAAAPVDGQHVPRTLHKGKGRARRAGQEDRECALM